MFHVDFFTVSLVLAARRLYLGSVALLFVLHYIGASRNNNNSISGSSAVVVATAKASKAPKASNEG